MAATGEHSRNSDALSPQEIGARVAAILDAAERDAREIIAAARRDVTAEEAPTPPASRGLSEGGAPGAVALARALESLSACVASFERAIDARIEVLWRTLAPQPEGEAPAAPEEPSGRNAGARAERFRAVDLALRGFSRAQIAAELRASMGEAQIEQLLNDVLERA